MFPGIVRPWHEYVLLALKAEHCYQRDRHYVSSLMGQVQIVDASTGRIFESQNMVRWIAPGRRSEGTTADQLRIPAACSNHSSALLPKIQARFAAYHRYYLRMRKRTGEKLWYSGSECPESVCHPRREHRETHYSAEPRAETDMRLLQRREITLIVGIRQS